MKKFFCFIALLLPLLGVSQVYQITANRVFAGDSLRVNDWWIKQITRDLNTSDSLSDSKLPTNKAVMDMIRSRSGGGGGATPSLQDVTDAGNTTTNDIIIGSRTNSVGRFSVEKTFTSLNVHAFDDYSTLNPASGGFGFGTFDASTAMIGSQTNDHFVGFQSRLTVDNTANINGNYGLTGMLIFNHHPGSGTITNAHGILIREIDGGGPITNAYGIKIAPVISATNNFAIRAEGGKSSFVDPVMIGAHTTPIAQLDVRSSAQDQTLYCDNTKAGGIAAIFNSSNPAGGSVALDITASGAGGGNKGISFAASSMNSADWNYYANNNARFYNKGKVGIGDGVTSPDSTLQINGSFHSNAGVRMEGLPIASGTMAVRIDANGNLSRGDTSASGGGSSYTFTNGITESSGTAKLGGTLTETTTINTAGNTTIWTGSNDNETSFSVTNTGTTSASAISGTASGATSTGVTGTSTSYIGVFGNSTSNTGVQGQSSSGVGVIGVSSTGAGLRAQNNPSSNNAIENTITLLRTSSSGAGANGIGAAIQYELETATNGNSQTAGSLAFKWTDATTVTRTSAFEIYGVNSATTARKAALAGNGQWTWDGYGSATHSVTPATTPVISSSGVIGERIAPKIYTAFISATVGNDPTVTVLGTNEIGNIVWTRSSAGTYLGTLSGAFPSNKTWLVIQRGSGTTGFVNGWIFNPNTNSVQITTYDNVGNLVDVFDNISFEIRVYP